MDGLSSPPLARALAGALRDSRNYLTGRWLERLAARVDLELNNVFPTDELLDHMPLLIGGIADDLEDVANPIRADSEVVHRAMELGGMRHAQGFDEYEVLKEFEIVGRRTKFSRARAECSAHCQSCSRRRSRSTSSS